MGRKPKYEVPRCDCGEELRAIIQTNVYPIISRSGKSLQRVKVATFADEVRFLRCFGNYERKCDAVYWVARDERQRLVKGARVR